MKRLPTLTKSLMALLLLFAMGACATSSTSQQEGKATEGFDKGKRLLDKNIKKDQPYSIDTARVYSYHIPQ